MDNTEYKYRVAVATTDGIVVNQHFGRADEFLIIGLDHQNQIHRIEKRHVNPVCDGGEHDEKRLESTVSMFADCKYVLVSRIGEGAAHELEKSGITPIELPGVIEESVQSILVHELVLSIYL